MHKKILILIFVLTTKLCFGQIEHLVPTERFEQQEGFVKEYYDGVLPLLHKGYTEKPIARYTVLPSFSSEYSFSIEEFDGKKYLISNKLSENYWYAKSKSKVKLTSSKTALTDGFYYKISELFKLLEVQTKKPENILYGNDGVNYYFTTTGENGRIKTGTTWSPRNKTLLGDLVEICDDIYSMSFDRNISWDKILKDVNELIGNLKD